MLTDGGKWQAERRDDPVPTEEISRTYRFSGVRGSNAALRIACIVQCFAQHGSLENRVRFYLWPIRLEEEEAAVWVMGFSKMDESQAGIFRVLARAVEGEMDTWRLLLEIKTKLIA